MKVHITWMDGSEKTYHCDSSRVWEGVLVLQGRVRQDEEMAGDRKRRINIPVVNIRCWDDDTASGPAVLTES